MEVLVPRTEVKKKAFEYSAEKIHSHPFVSEGYVSLSEDSPSVPILCFRDTGCHQSLLLSNVLPFSIASQPLVKLLDILDVVVDMEQYLYTLYF